MGILKWLKAAAETPDKYVEVSADDPLPVALEVEVDIGTVVGPDAAGAVATDDPVQVAGLDGDGKVRPLATDADGNLQVDVLTAPGQAAEGAALPAVLVVVAADDGTDTHPLQTDAAGALKVLPQANPGVDIGDVDVATLAEYTPEDVDTGGTSRNALPVALMLPGATPAAAPGDATNGVDVDVTRMPAVASSRLLSPTGGSKTVTVPGTAEALAEGSTKRTLLYVRAKAGNVGLVYVGDSTVDKDTSPQVALAAGAAFTFSAPGGYCLDVSEFYVDAAEAGEGVDFLYL